MAYMEEKKQTDGQPGGGRTALARTVAAAVVALVAIAIATGGFGLFGGNGVQPGRQAGQTSGSAQAVQPSADDRTRAADEVKTLKPLAGTKLDDAAALQRLAAALPLSDKGPEVQADAAGHALTVSFSGIDEETGKKAASAGTLDGDLLHAAVGWFACIEDLQQLTLNVPGAGSHALRRGELEQALGGPVNASSSLTEDAWAEILRKVGTQGLASGLMGLATESGRQAAGATVGGSGSAQ